MNILITNDDGYSAKGVHILAEIMCQFGNVTVIAPKLHQSGMSMAVSLGLKQIAYRELPDEKPGKWSYLDATPASCVKFALNGPYSFRPDVVLSGINHGSNAATAACYSGTLGAAEEAALNGIPAIGVSLESVNPDADFSAVKKYFPDIFRKLMANLPEKQGVFYNVNFPNIPESDIKGVRVGYQGYGYWTREFKEWDPNAYSKLGITPEMLGQSSVAKYEEGEELFMMVGDFIDGKSNDERADHWLTKNGYISIVPDNLDATDYEDRNRLQKLGFDTDFQSEKQ